MITHDNFRKPVLPPRDFGEHPDNTIGMPDTPEDRERATLNAKQMIADSLTPAEIDEFNQTIDALEAGIESGGHFPGGNVKAFLKSKSPRVQHWLQVMADYVRTPRELPFMAKRSEQENADRLGLDPEIATLIISALDGVDVIDGVRDRLNAHTPTDATSPGMSRRDATSAALDAHMPGAIRAARIEDDIADAGEGLTLRQALEILVGETERMEGAPYAPPKRTREG